ncbi:hypothetical protein AL542_01625 [Grimontia hollisae]|uniref:hypothetical protein n=1 Tax=Grimontia hollisae TaxID=673 RepID=UPI00058AEC87|nr:hypothetical protein [Grimontia hollisae]AMG29169.1 hypothetical protein AL542_01625 [Grimontia hollisae]MDF2184964.1 hypothetical protein [Grimontia hollisae]
MEPETPSGASGLFAVNAVLMDAFFAFYSGGKTTGVLIYYSCTTPLFLFRLKYAGFIRPKARTHYIPDDF